MTTDDPPMQNRPSVHLQVDAIFSKLLCAVNSCLVILGVSANFVRTKKKN